jgi:hypothetical protein
MELDLYLELMNEVKKRTTAVIHILSKEKTTSFRETNIEFMCLQIRKILELISLGSLVANRKEFENEQIKYQKFWHAERILKDIERLNPDFYPKPITEVRSENPNIENSLEDKTEGFLTIKEFIKVYEKCGKMMHADNPFGSKVDFDFYERQIADWLANIMGLLNTHMIKLKGHEDFFLIQMHVQEDDLVHGYFFKEVENENDQKGP